MAQDNILKPKDVDPTLLKRLEDQYGPVDIVNDFFNRELTSYFKTTDINDETGSVTHTQYKLASFGDSLQKMYTALKSLKRLTGTDDARNDQTIRKILVDFKEVFNQYRTHLRKFYPDQYNQIKSQLKEISTTGGGAGAASFTPGTGMAYATPYAFRLSGSKANDKAYTEIGYKTVKENVGANLGPGPKASEDGVKDNAYVKDYGYKLVPSKIKGSGLEVKQLFENSSVDDFQKERIAAFDLIEQEMNDIYKMLSNAKNETADYYSENPASYTVIKPTDLVLDYIKDIKDLLKGE
jgi:hypothetical protein|tara:strand:+ start:1342 stop:2226 length:885 start_codon:yes stop_codon:yes gene_type:complete